MMPDAAKKSSCSHGLDGYLALSRSKTDTVSLARLDMLILQEYCFLIPLNCLFYASSSSSEICLAKNASLSMTRIESYPHFQPLQGMIGFSTSHSICLYMCVHRFYRYSPALVLGNFFAFSSNCYCFQWGSIRFREYRWRQIEGGGHQDCTLAFASLISLPQWFFSFYFYQNEFSR